MFIRHLLILGVSLFFCIHSQSQNLTQTIRGIVFDKDSKVALEGATVVIKGSNPIIGSVTDVKGNFKLTNVPVGRQDVKIILVGYNEVEVSNLLLSSAKEIVLDIAMEEKVIQMEQVVVKAQVRKDKPINEMAVISARSFTIEETEKYAGSRGDVARMASNYAGVSFANDERNDIVIRGNSPAGLLWRLEDVDVPNPNHFAENGTTGGPVGMLNNNVLKNSDFFTGAFPAEYGNALSGVFDLKMRNGNNEKREYIGQIGFNGFELGAEGPFTSKHSGSYLINMRYSTLRVLDKMGVDFGTGGVPKYFDGSAKINIPLEKGLISLFFIGGKSQIAMLDRQNKSPNKYSQDDRNTYSNSAMNASGLSYTHFLSSKTYMKFIVSGIYQSTSSQVNEVDTTIREFDHNIEEYRTGFSFIISSKYNNQFSSKSGITVDRMGYNLNTVYYDEDSLQYYTLLKGNKSLLNGTTLYRAYFEMIYKLTDFISFHPGVHLMYFNLNKKISLEPRFGISWIYAKNRRLNFGYGLHSRLNTLASYFLGTNTFDTLIFNGNKLYKPVYIETNRNLGFIKSHQFVIGHDWTINENLRLKVESYYQYLYNVPVMRRRTLYSILNTGTDWGINSADSLVNDGTGYNYGCEITFEKFLSSNYYFLTTISLFDSKYRGSDDTLRNTTYNGNYVFNFLTGYEYVLNSQWSLTFDGKITYAGGKRYIPINEINSEISGHSEYDYYKAFQERYPDFLKIDLKIGIRHNKPKYSEEWQLYIENITDHKNILGERYNKSTGKVVKTYQMGRFPGLFPLILYRLNF